MTAEATRPELVRVADRARGGQALWLWVGWFASRTLTALLLFPEHKVFGDVRYYFASVDALLHGGSLGGTLQEYPVPAVGVMLFARLLSGPWPVVYLWLFCGLMLAVDALFAHALFRAASWRWRSGVVLWLAMMPLLGPMVLCRFDLLPAALAGGALLTVTRRPVASGVLAGLGAAVKLWPAALLPSLWLAAPRGTRARLVGAFAAVVAASAALVAVLGGADRLVSPLHWQGERGLQVEAFAALPLLVADLFRPERWHVTYTRYYAFQVDGPGVGAALTVASVAMLAAVAGLAVLWLRAIRSDHADKSALAVLLATLTVIALTVTDKTLSPQYLVWIAALLAVAAVTHSDVVPRAAVPILLVTCAATHVIFPWWYDLLVAGRPYAVLLLVARDLGLAAIGVLVTRRLWALSRGRTA